MDLPCGIAGILGICGHKRKIAIIKKIPSWPSYCYTGSSRAVSLTSSMSACTWIAALGNRSRFCPCSTAIDNLQLGLRQKEIAPSLHTEVSMYTISWSHKLESLKSFAWRTFAISTTLFMRVDALRPFLRNISFVDWGRQTWPPSHHL